MPLQQIRGKRFHGMVTFVGKCAFTVYAQITKSSETNSGVRHYYIWQFYFEKSNKPCLFTGEQWIMTARITAQRLGISSQKVQG